MPKKVKTTTLLGQIQHTLMKSKLSTINSFLLMGKRQISLTFETGGSKAYTRLIGTNKDHAQIVLGGRLIIDSIPLPDNFDDKNKFLPFWDDIISRFYGFNYHELGHNLFTDMVDPIIINYPTAQYRNFLHTLFNISIPLLYAYSPYK